MSRGTTGRRIGNAFFIAHPEQSTLPPFDQVIETRANVGVRHSDTHATANRPTYLPKTPLNHLWDSVFVPSPHRQSDIPSHQGQRTLTTSNYTASMSVAQPQNSSLTAVSAVLDSIVRDGDLLDYRVIEHDGHALTVYGQVPREELEAYLTVRRKLRERYHGVRPDIELDTHAIER